MPATIKERIKEFIPKEMIDTIATENEAKTIDEMKDFLKKTEHPIVERWKTLPVEAAPKVEEVEAVATSLEIPFSGVPITAGGFEIILKDAKIYAKKVIIRRVKK
ncbi:acetyl-CoA decarbonylase/synthase complex subunit beta, partial [Candidatus Bathyarchaeota archaeon]|nr:acetyl-CoA decarbonylase/synthase complex subunit beta [Candidatus Bathyarchaeota archaeon]